MIWIRRYDGKSAKKLVLERFEKQKTRGVDGFGFIEVDIQSNDIKRWIQTQDETEMREGMKHATAHEILFHHRFPTSTPNVVEATHPIAVKHSSLTYDYYGVHNGIISNADYLHTKYVKEGFEYTTEMQEGYFTRGKSYATGKVKFNDSESLMIDLAKCIEGKKEKTESYGSIAFIIYQVKKDTRHIEAMYFGRNTNPLVLKKSNKVVSLASTGDGETVEPHVLWKFDYATGNIDKVRDFEIGFKEKKVEKQPAPIPSPFPGLGTGNGTTTSTSAKMDPEDIDAYLAGFHLSLPEQSVSKYSILQDKEGTGFTLSVVGSTKTAHFPSKEVFEDMYWELVEAIEFLKDEIKAQKDLKNWNAMHEAQEQLDKLQKRMTKYDEVYELVHEKIVVF